MLTCSSPLAGLKRVAFKPLQTLYPGMLVPGKDVLSHRPTRKRLRVSHLKADLCVSDGLYDSVDKTRTNSGTHIKVLGGESVCGITSAHPVVAEVGRRVKYIS